MHNLFIDKLPECDFCKKPAIYDSPTIHSYWAYMCESCYKKHGRHVTYGTKFVLEEKENMENTERLSPDTLCDIRQNVPMSRTDDFTDDQIDEMSNAELFAHWMDYQGIQGFNDNIKQVLSEIYGVEFKED